MAGGEPAMGFKDGEEQRQHCVAVVHGRGMELLRWAENPLPQLIFVHVDEAMRVV